MAVCDVYKPHLPGAWRRPGNPDVKTYLDYRDLFADPKVEAVVIATPDHWHEAMLVDASNAGKAVYCEKGWTTSIAAAKRMRETVRKNKTIMQLGHQGREYPASAAAGKMIREGRLGPVTFVKTGRYFNSPPDKPVWRWYGYYDWFERPDPKQVLPRPGLAEVAGPGAVDRVQRKALLALALLLALRNRPGGRPAQS